MNLIHADHPVRSVHPLCAWYHGAHDGQPFLRDSGRGTVVLKKRTRRAIAIVVRGKKFVKRPNKR
jgi:hypothetical protein